jgi:hypothetical protein
MFWRSSLFAIFICLEPGSIAQSAAGDFFAIQVVDESTGRGIPMVMLETVNGLRQVTDSAGWAAFQEPGMMDRKVFFSMSSPGYVVQRDDSGLAGVTVFTKAGASVQVKMVRTEIAERVYRVTGQGIYRDSSLLARESPLPQANLFADVMAAGSVQAVQYGGKIFWLWRDALTPSHPRGRSQTIAATSDLVDHGGLHPSLGVHFKHYLSTGGDGARDMVPMTESGTVWLDGLLAVKDGEGKERLIAHYSRMKDAITRLEHGLVEFNDESGVFEKVIMLGEEFQWQCPRGQSVHVRENGVDWLYFADPFCHTRVKADYDSVMNPSAYESLSYSSATQATEWTARAEPMLQDEEAILLAGKKMPGAAARYSLVDAATGKPVRVQAASIRWSEFRKRWIMIAVQKPDYRDYPAGEVWYAESGAAVGPWAVAVKVAGHAGNRFLGPCHHSFFDQENGRVIFFEGTFSRGESQGTELTPRYEQNQLMYRLDLSDRRLKAAQEQL